MKKILYILITVCLFVSCEYDPKGVHFVELTPPDDFVPIEISLNDINPSDTIYVFQDTRVSIKINTRANKEFQRVVVFFNGNEFHTLWGNTSNFTLRPNELGEGVHKLTINAIFASGSGSLADMMGMEGYMGEMSWNICVIPDPEKHFTIDYRLNEKGFLEIHWENTISEHSIQNYVVSILHSKEIIIDDPTQTSFIDYGYVCGYAEYLLTTNLKAGYSYSQRIFLDKPVPNIYFEEMGTNLRIYWDKPFANGRFTLIEGTGTGGDDTIVSEINDTTVTISQIFGRQRPFMLNVNPQKAEYGNNYNEYISVSYFLLGISLVGMPAFPQIAYNKTDNIIYQTRYYELVALDATTLEEKNSIKLNDNINNTLRSVVSALNNSTVAALAFEGTWIFSDSNFTNPIVISGVRGNVTGILSALTSDNRFFWVGYNSNNCQVFNVINGEKIFDFSFTHIPSYSPASRISVSDDGHYFCVASDIGIEVFEIAGTTVKQLYSDTRRTLNAMFVPNHPDKLLIRVNSSDFEVRQMPNFNLIQKLEVSAMNTVLCNIDPVTENLLYYQDGFLKVAPVDNLNNLLFEIRVDVFEVERCRLYNNKLLTAGIAFDISSYINRQE